MGHALIPLNFESLQLSFSLSNFHLNATNLIRMYINLRFTPLKYYLFKIHYDCGRVTVFKIKVFADSYYRHK